MTSTETEDAVDGPFAPLPVDPDGVTEAYALFWKHMKQFPDYPRATRLRDMTSMRTPDGIHNPYWDLLLDAPIMEHMGYASVRAPYPLPVTEVIVQTFQSGAYREAMCFHYSYAIPSPMDLRLIVWAARGRGVVEIGAGTGYWAEQLAQLGVDVVAYDPAAPGSGRDNRWVTGGPYHPILEGDTDAAAEHPDRALMMCWPLLGSMPSDALAAYRGDTLILCAARADSGDAEFWDRLSSDWYCTATSYWHLVFYGMKDGLWILRRRTTRRR